MVTSVSMPMVAPGAPETVLLRLSRRRHDAPFADAMEVLVRRQAEADAFYGALSGAAMSEDARWVQRQAFAGLLWGKQFYYYDVAAWLEGDPTAPPPPPQRRCGHNAAWPHLDSADVLSMPDTWKYPWYAAWDLAFHCIPLALIDQRFGKRQLIQLLKVWYMHPNGQLPAYEWAFGDVNPPVHAWAAWRVYKIQKRLTGTADRSFLERVFHKLLLNFTWWVNRKDRDGRNVFQTQRASPWNRPRPLAEAATSAQRARSSACTPSGRRRRSRTCKRSSALRPKAWSPQQNQ